MQAMVPQFIDVEDKITPFLTIKQFFFLVAAGAFCALLYPFFETTPWLIISAIVLGIGGAFGFIRIQGRPFSVVALAAIKYIWNPRLYMYQKIASTQKREERPKTVEKGEERAQKILPERLQQIARLLDAKGTYK